MEKQSYVKKLEGLFLIQYAKTSVFIPHSGEQSVGRKIKGKSEAMWGRGYRVKEVGSGHRRGQEDRGGKGQRVPWVRRRTELTAHMLGGHSPHRLVLAQLATLHPTMCVTD